jgi:hypothetical protein
MKLTLGALVAGIAYCALSPAGAPANETLRVSEFERVFELSVPVSRLVMSIPKAGLVQMNAPVGANHPRYFYFVGGADAVNISGWIESAQRFRGVSEFWKSETGGWRRQGLPDPVDVRFIKVGGWEAIVYDMSSPVGSNSHVRAHWVQAGTWIDLHISTIQNASAESRNRLLEMLRSIEVREK